MNFLEYDFSRFHHKNFRDTISWECIVKDDCVRSCLIELQSFPLCVGEGFVSRPHLLGEVHRGSYYLTSGKLKGRRNCLRLMRNERRKMKLMERSRKSERTLTSCMVEMRQTLGHLEPCDVCKR